MATSHDLLFKQLLRKFFWEFLELFFPGLASTLDRDLLRFEDTEVGPPAGLGPQLRPDLLVTTRFKGGPEFLIHVEHEAQRPRLGRLPGRMWTYGAGLTQSYGLSVYPIAVISAPGLREPQPEVYEVRFPDLRPVRYQYRVLQLHRMDWRRFRHVLSPVAVALMPRMGVRRRDRPKAKAACMRILVKLDLDAAGRKILEDFLTAWLTLDEQETAAFEAEIRDIPAGEREPIMKLMNEWEQKGRKDEARRMLGIVLRSRLGEVPETLRRRLEIVPTHEDLEALAERAATCDTMDEFLRALEEAQPDRS